MLMEISDYFSGNSRSLLDANLADKQSFGRSATSPDNQPVMTDSHSGDLRYSRQAGSNEKQPFARSAALPGK